MQVHMLAKIHNTLSFYWHLGNSDSMLFSAISEDNFSGGVEYALDRGADINVKWIGNSVLHEAIEWSETPAIMVPFLIEKGANVNAISTKGVTVLSFACTPHEYYADNPNAEALKVVKLLLEKGANITARNSDGSTALEYAIKSGSLAIVKLLLGKGAEVETKLLDCVIGPDKVEISNILTQKLTEKTRSDTSLELADGYTPNKLTSEEYPVIEEFVNPSGGLPPIVLVSNDAEDRKILCAPSYITGPDRAELDAMLHKELDTSNETGSY